MHSDRPSRRLGRLVVTLLVFSTVVASRISAQVFVEESTAIHIYFKSAWAFTKIHYSVNGGDWTVAPGVDMTSSSHMYFPANEGWVKFDAPESWNTLDFVFNDGSGVWDNNGGANYNAKSRGLYQIGGGGSSACSTFSETCTGLSYPGLIDGRRWQTPPRNNTNWKSAYQDYRSLQGYAHVVYSAGYQSATVTVKTFLREAAACSYKYNGVSTSSATYTAKSDLMDALQIVVTCTKIEALDTWTLSLEPVNFLWQNTLVVQPTEMEGGQRGAIVDLFGWPYKDIESECKDFLGKAGYMGVKINPPMETLLSDTELAYGQRNPWYFVYQPVSYRLYSRLGSRADLRSMIETCRANGVRVYADAVINHMAAAENDMNPTHRKDNNGACRNWGPHSSSGGSPFYSHKYQYETNAYTGQNPVLEYPAVPYGPSDFHCDRGMSDYSNPTHLGEYWLVGLADLDTSKTFVRERIAQFLVDLLGIGFHGFRIDAFKHMHPKDIAAIFGLFNKYMGGSLPTDFISWGEILLGNDANMLACDETNDFNFYKGLDNRYKEEGLSDVDIAKLKIWSSDYPKNFPVCGRWILPSEKFVIQNDDHDQQSSGSTSREMGDQGSVLIVAKDVNAHRRFEQKLFSRQDGDWKIKVVLSSYTFTPAGAAGFPDGYSQCRGSPEVSCSLSMPYQKAFQAGSCGYTVGNFEGGQYTRVHRDLPIVNSMRSWLGVGTVSASDVGITGPC